MKNRTLPMVLCALLLCGCVSRPAPEVPTTAVPEPSVPAQTTLPPETEPAAPPTQPPLFVDALPGLGTEYVIRYFNEVCLDAEIVNSGDPSRLQKWAAPILFTIQGEPTDDDLQSLFRFTAWLNGIEGFPGIWETEDPLASNLTIHFCSAEDMALILGDWTYGMDGAVTFWYQEDVINLGTICCRSDVDQTVRNSVILEELYNCLGPIQDTDLRTDSIIYSGYSEPQWLSAEDELILRLLYHPDMLCGMDSTACADVINHIYR